MFPKGMLTKKSLDRSDLTITETTLEEIRKRATNCKLDYSHLPYHDVQAILTIYGLIDLIESYGIKPQISLEIKRERNEG